MMPAPNQADICAATVTARLLEARLGPLLGGVEVAWAAVVAAMARARVDRLPTDAEGLLAFCAEHLVMVLAEVADPRTIGAFLGSIQRDAEVAFAAARPRTRLL